MAYNWTSTGTTALVDKGNAIVGTSVFGQNSNNGNRMQPDAYYSDMFLERKRFKAEELVFANYAETREIKKGLDTINLRRYQPLKAHIVPLVEGMPPAADRAAGKAIIAKTRQYGRYMEFTDQFEYKVSDPVIEEYTMELADLANETIDMLAQAALLAEAQTYFAPKRTTDPATGAVTTVAVTTIDGLNTDAKPSFEDLRVIKLTMEAAKVKPINGVYVVLASPAVYFDLQADIDSSTIGRYMRHGQTNAPMVNDDIPVMYGIQVKKAHTAHTSKNAGGLMVHHTIMLGAKAYTKVTISGSGGVEWFKQALGSAGTLDPLHQRQTMGWKISNLGFKVTDPDAVVDYMSIPSQADIVFDNFDYVTEKASEIGIKGTMAAFADLCKEDGTTPATSLDDAVKGYGAAYKKAMIEGTENQFVVEKDDAKKLAEISGASKLIKKGMTKADYLIVKAEINAAHTGAITTADPADDSAVEALLPALAEAAKKYL